LILVDTSIWADHFRSPDASLAALLDAREVVTHRLVVEELAMGHLPQREKSLAMLWTLERLAFADAPALISYVETHDLVGTGIGLADAHLLFSAVHRAIPIWTRDKRLALQAQRLGCALPAD
jgi:predicted nucleic acid-binding protein